MDQTEALVKTIVEGLQEKKGKNIVTVDLTQLSGSICQYMIICEGSTPTQVSALSDSAWDFAHRKAGEKPLSIDGAQRAEARHGNPIDFPMLQWEFEEKPRPHYNRP